MYRNGYKAPPEPASAFDPEAFEPGVLSHESDGS